MKGEMTVGAWAQIWFRTHAEGKLSDNTVSGYTRLKILHRWNQRIAISRVFPTLALLQLKSYNKTTGSSGIKQIGECCLKMNNTLEIVR